MAKAGTGGLFQTQGSDHPRFSLLDQKCPELHWDIQDTMLSWWFADQPPHPLDLRSGRERPVSDSSRDV